MFRPLLPLAFLLAASAMAQAPTTVLVAAPHPSLQARLAYDTARQRVVLSEAGQPAWEYDGSAWAHRDVPLPAGAMLYDPSTERVLVVGTAGVLAYDGNTSTVIGPPLPALEVVVDTVRGRLVALTTAAGGGVAGIEFWEFDGSVWSQVAQIPGNRGPFGAAYDPTRGATVLAVDYYRTGVQHEIWEWDGTTLRGPLQPGAGERVLAFDPASQQVLTAGVSGASLWNGTAVTPVSSSYEDQYGLICVDEVHGSVLRSWENSLWRWTGTSWQNLGLTPMPRATPARFSYDTKRSRAVLLGTAGPWPGMPLHAEWDGTAWHTLPIGPGAPTALYLHAQAFDAARGETVVFGGSLGLNGLGPVVGTTYAWNGTSWRLAATTGPSARRGAGMTYDSIRQRVVLAGGRNPSTQSSLFDHWEWNGVTWTQIAPFTPFAGSAVLLGFDPVRNRLVAHDTQGRTFESTGAVWTLATLAGPVPDYAFFSGDIYNELTLPSLAWDAANQVLVANCRVGNTIVPFGWNGASWTQLTLPSGLHAAVLATGALLVANPDSLQLVSNLPARAESYGAGCGGSATVTSLVAFGRPVLGNGTFQLDLRADARLLPAVFGFGDSMVVVPFGNGCSLRVGGVFALELGVTDNHGFARLPLPIPTTLALRGLQLQAQGLAFDPASAGGLAFTQGLTLTLGD